MAPRDAREGDRPLKEGLRGAVVIIAITLAIGGLAYVMAVAFAVALG